MSVELSHRLIGGKTQPPVLILHGLLGSSRNWLAAGRELAQQSIVYALDLRNHGASPHTDEMDYELMVEDVMKWMHGHLAEKPLLIGHSMGGKVAMTLACRHPQSIKGIVVADIAPMKHTALEGALSAMDALPLENLKTRKEAEEQMAEHIPELGMRRFLLTNLQRNNAGAFYWGVHLKCIKNSREILAENPVGKEDKYVGPSLFIRGALSDFVPDSIIPNILYHFPHASVDTLAQAGHNAHIDNKAGFVQSVKNHFECQF